jgi:hypothetical protein
VGGGELAEGAGDVANLVSSKSTSSGSGLGPVDALSGVTTVAIVGATDILTVGGGVAEGDADAANRASSKAEPCGSTS